MKSNWLKTSPTSKRKRLSLLLLIFTGIVVFCLACGKKGPPVSPTAIIPPAITDLKAEILGDQVRLTWSFPKEKNEPMDGLECFRIYKYKSSTSVETCEGCPMPFEHLRDIKLEDPEPARIEGDWVIWNDNIDPDYHYAYKVVTCHKSGGISEDSNIVEFTAGLPATPSTNSPSSSNQ